MLHRVPNPDGSFEIVDIEDADDGIFSPQGTGAPQEPAMWIGRGSPDGVAPLATASTSSTGSTGTTTSTGALAAETITHAGSGLVFNNTYGSGVTTTFRNEIVAAENYLQSQFTNNCTINCSFNLQSLNPAFSGENSFNPVVVSYATYVNALASHAISSAQKAAVASLQGLSDPSGGAGFMVPVGEARILGLAGGPAAGTADDMVVLNSAYWTASALQNNPGDAEAVIEHEVTEGGMGRIGSLGVADTDWAPMDLFRFTASGQRDFTGGQDGQATYFSVDGTSVNTGLRYHGSVSTSGQFDGEDFADWDQAGQDASARDPFGPGGPGAGDPGTLSATDLQIMNVLGWNQPSADGITLSATRTDAVQGGAALTLLANAPTITDSRSSTITSATIKVANGSGTPLSGDELFVAAVQSGTVSGVSVSWSAATGTLTLSGSASIATYQTLLSQVAYQDTGTDTSSGAHPVRTVTWSVNDGTQTLSTTSQVTVDRAPTVTVANMVETAGASTVALSSQAVYGDADGDPAAVWRIEDISSDSRSALLLNGTPIAPNSTVGYTPAQFAQITIAPVTSPHDIWVVATDGTVSSTPTHFTVMPPSPDRPPTVTVANLQETAGASPVPLSSQAVYSDPDGDPAASWRIEDVSSDGRSALLLNGTPITPNNTVAYTPAQFAQITIAQVTASHDIWVVATDGTLSSTPTHFTVSPPSGSSSLQTPPTVTVTNLQETAGAAPVALSSQATYSDPDGDPAASWRIEDVSSDGQSALLLNGTPITPNNTSAYTPAQFAQITIAQVTTSHDIWVVATDGTSSSTPTHFTVTPPSGELVFSNSSTPGAAPVVIADGGSAELVYSASPVSFIGSSGTLQLDNSAGFSGQIFRICRTGSDRSAGYRVQPANRSRLRGQRGSDGRNPDRGRRRASGQSCPARQLRGVTVRLIE
jgi:hypothetical protein